MALLLLSTAVFVVNVQKAVPTVDTGSDGMFAGYRETVRSTLISALANASNGGGMDVLGINLSELKQVIIEHSYQAMITMSYSVSDSSPYSGGVWISWGTSGKGISSTCADFVFAQNSPTGASSIAYTLNVSSQVNLSGSYKQLNDSMLVNLAIELLNEGAPALAQSFVFQYQNGSDWVMVDSPVIVDHGDGSYAVSFSAQTGQIDESLNVSAVCLDQRGISVGANLTCNHI